MKPGDLAYVDVPPPFGGYTIATTMRYNVEWQKFGGAGSNDSEERVP